METPPTKLQKMGIGGQAIGDQTMLVQGTAPMLPAYADQYYLTDEDTRDMGKRDDEVYTWVRHDKHWEEHEGKSRMREFQHTHPGGRFPKDKSGQYRTNDDLVLAFYPAAQKEAEEAAQQRAYEEYVADIAEREDEIPHDLGGNPMSDQQALRLRSRQVRRDNQRNGITGTSTSGMSLEAAESSRTIDEIRAEEDSFRAGQRRR